MTWVRLDDQWADHPKFLDVGDYGQLVWVKGLSYAARYLTDGFIPARAVSKFLQATRHVRGAVAELVKAGLWVPAEGGYQVHDYKDYQPLASQVKAERVATRERVKRWRERQFNTDGNDVTNGVSNGLRAGAHAGAGQGSGSESGSGSPTLPGRSELEAELRKHPVFASLSAEVLARQQAEFMITAPQKLDWVIRAISDCAAAHSALGLTAPELQRKLVGYMRNARKPRVTEDEPTATRKVVEFKEDPAHRERARLAREEKDRVIAERLAREAAQKAGAK